MRTSDYAAFHPPREYFGERQAEPLVEWLNKRRGTREHQKVVSLLRDFQALGSIARGVALSRDDLSRQEEALARKIDRKLAPYRMRPKVKFVGRRGSLGFEWVSTAGKRNEGVIALIQVATVNLARRVRQCLRVGCGNWFYARFIHQNFCATSCQQAHYRSSDEWKAHRREWMRAYRENVK